jgi:hypothetical protein
MILHTLISPTMTDTLAAHELISQKLVTHNS